MKKNAKGEMEYEIKETYIDENVEKGYLSLPG